MRMVVDFFRIGLLQRNCQVELLLLEIPYCLLRDLSCNGEISKNICHKAVMVE